MRKQKNLLTFTLHGAVGVSVAMPLVQWITKSESQYGLLATVGITFCVGLVVSPIIWLIQRQFRRKEDELIAQIQREAKGSSNKTVQASDAGASQPDR